MTPSTELPLDFCAGIGPLQLGIIYNISKNHFMIPMVQADEFLHISSVKWNFYGLLSFYIFTG